MKSAKDYPIWVIVSPDIDRQQKVSKMLTENGLTNHRLIEGMFFRDYNEVAEYFRSHGESWRMTWERIKEGWGIGTWGCLAAHLKLWSMLDEPTIVLEDDVEFNPNFSQFDLENYFENYEFITLHTKKTYGPYAYLLNRQGAVKLIENLPPKLKDSPDGTIDLRIVRRKVKGLKVHRTGLEIFKHIGVPNDETTSIRLQLDNNRHS